MMHPNFADMFLTLLTGFQDVMQVTVKYDKQFFVVDSISKSARCSDLLPLLKARLGTKIPGSARLMKNGRFLRMDETIEEVLKI